MRIARQRLRWTQVVYSMFSVLTIAKGSELPTLLPNDPEGLVGEDMHLWCSVSTQSQTVQNLKFSIAYRNSHTFHSFSANDSIALNGTTARLTISSLTDKHDKAKIYCENEQTAVFQVITVGREPATPKIYYFRYMNWETFEFRWKLDHKYNGFETKYTAWFKGSEDRDFIRCDEKKMPNCIGQNEHVCSVPTAFLHTKWDGFVFFKVNGTNKAGNVSSITMKKLLERIVQPGPAKILGVRAENNTDVVSYLRPEEDHNLDITFVAVSTENPNKKRKWTHRSNKQSKKRVQNQTLAGLEPFVKYQLTIHIKSIVSKFRSERSNRTFTSHEEVPSQAPEVCRGCFENDGKSTILHFKPLTKRQSRGIVTYTVKLESLSSAVRTGKNSTATGERSFVDISNHAAYFSRSQEAFHFNYTENEALFKLPNMSGGDTAYRLEIFASTSSGSGPSTFVEIPTKSQIPSPPTNCSVMTVGNSSEVVFRWNNPGFGQRLETYTAVWCKGSMNRMLCERPIDWKEVRGNESSVSVTLKSDYSRHMFGIAATEEDGRSSGIRWSCFFHDRNSVASPPHIYPLRIDETVIELQLGMPRYSPKEGLIYGYNLYYSKLNDKDDENAVAIYLEERATRGIARIEGLERGKSYRFMAESLTLAGPSTLKTSRVLATKPFNFSSAEITGIVSVLILLCILAVFGFICCVRFWTKAAAKIRLFHRIRTTAP